MYVFSTEQTEQTSESIETLIDSIIEMENVGDLSGDDIQECIYYLKKISHITGADIDFDDLNDQYQNL